MTALSPAAIADLAAAVAQAVPERYSRVRRDVRGHARNVLAERLRPDAIDRALRLAERALRDVAIKAWPDLPPGVAEALRAIQAARTP